MASRLLGTTLLCLSLLSCILASSSIGERDLPELALASVSQLISNPDPVKQLDPANPASHLSKILIPRVSGTENNTLVGNYIISTLEALKWHIETDEFTEETPIGSKSFRNIIATYDPTASRRVILAAHYDSKYGASYPDNQFVGATDSAAPCAMMLDLAETLNPLLGKRKERLDKGILGDDEDEDVIDTTLQLVFFDGEEAFVSWTATDSIYGARHVITYPSHLASKWESEYDSPHEKRRLMGMQANKLDGIEHLILLDLLGAPQPSIRSFFLDTAWLFDHLVSLESRLGDTGAFAYGEAQQMAPGKWKSYFKPRQDAQINYGFIGDDHVPFLQKGVSILHLIPEPFPSVWHTLKLLYGDGI
ncbi:hypothetical protein H0H93_012284 [Arthromyces matolae]|nr:hypothetical protein H0H93_012284 [Arthromyces matolae]